MGKFSGYLLCTDLDGTLLKNDKTISQENKQAINYFMENGGRFTFITGRMPYTARSLYEAIRPNAPIGCVNGGALYDYDSESYIWRQELDERAFELVEDIYEKTDVGIQVNTFDKIYYSRNNAAMEEFFRRIPTDTELLHWRDIPRPVAKVIFTELEEEKLCQVMELLHAHPLAYIFDFVRSEKILYELLPKGINKGTALKNLCAHLKLSPEKTIAVGDYNNDIGMLVEAKIGVAVANACADAKTAADIVTVSNEDHAIAKIIYDIENGTIII